MWSKIARYTLYTFVWILIAGYVIYSANLSRAIRQSQTIERIDIVILDSAMHGNLITTPMVRGWISGSSIKIIGQPLKDLPLGEIESRILKNGFVDQARIYPTRSGALKVELTQRHAALRLLMDGYNGYTTREGYIFEAPSYASIYLPIVTGGYRPPFPPSYRGNIDDFVKAQKKIFEERRQEIEREKYPLYEQEMENMEDIRELRRMFIKKGWFESDEKFDKKVVELRAKKAKLRKLYQYRSRVIADKIAQISAKQSRLDLEEKKLQKRCVDFMNLINFVHIVENDKFWSSEVVQIVASESHSGSLRVDLVVRSGDFKVEFGSLKSASQLQKGEEGVEEKLEKLMAFYENGLRRVGWNRYQTINVEYKNQVVCK
ncbi:MAG: hypothetical protein SNG27_01445 [Rikenellaceae bacterium]